MSPILCGLWVFPVCAGDVQRAWIWEGVYCVGDGVDYALLSWDTAVWRADAYIRRSKRCLGALHKYVCVILLDMRFVASFFLSWQTMYLLEVWGNGYR